MLVHQFIVVLLATARRFESVLLDGVAMVRQAIAGIGDGAGPGLKTSGSDLLEL